MKKFQITCKCPAYKFPHRLGGGKCDATDWTHDYYLFNKSECEYCNANNGYECAVSTGQESLSECEAYEAAIKNEVSPLIKLINPEELYNEQ